MTVFGEAQKAGSDAMGNLWTGETPWLPPPPLTQSFRILSLSSAKEAEKVMRLWSARVGFQEGCYVFSRVERNESLQYYCSKHPEHYIRNNIRLALSLLEGWLVCSPACPPGGSVRCIKGRAALPLSHYSSDAHSINSDIIPLQALILNSDDVFLRSGSPRVPTPAGSQQLRPETVCQQGGPQSLFAKSYVGPARNLVASAAHAWQDSRDLPYDHPARASRNLESVNHVLDALADAAIKWEESNTNEVTHRAL
ncbi:hypothetical protein Pcinc_024179 [Petrolisthes cinctipes]|uniref:Uncharacterized protein n=1 Tax=Petrolisthes cinctipes TaxID=88211 RepID=A0AAE1FBL0_PETCI|nr:hypothetical protein Pcinc_024179 [Petrolisthes cinctipes]